MRKMIFICTGNTCRSPMAEGFIKNYNIDNWEFLSRGISAVEGEPPSERAAKAMKELGVNIDNHVAKSLGMDEYEDDTIILTMTKIHKEYLRHLNPELMDKVLTIKEYVDDIGDINDPFGGTLNTYSETAKELKSIIEKIVEKIK